MQFQTPLVAATLIRRYKRFLADARLSDSSIVTAHCANPGAMTGLNMEGLRIWLEPNDDPKRKLNYSWKLVELGDDHWAGIDTSLPNRVVENALRLGRVPELAAYGEIRPEVAYGKNSRIDFLLSEPGLPDAYVEVKTVTLRRQGQVAEFPDTITKRGTKHLEELTRMIAQGFRAVMLYAIHRTDCTGFRVAADIDPDYARAFDAARDAGVEMLAYDIALSPEAGTLRNPLPVDADRQF